VIQHGIIAAAAVLGTLVIHKEMQHGIIAAAVLGNCLLEVYRFLLQNLFFIYSSLPTFTNFTISAIFTFYYLFLIVIQVCVSVCDTCAPVHLVLR
jgi:hypothetical protein